jgi:hypothetical protein
MPIFGVRLTREKVQFRKRRGFDSRRIRNNTSQFYTQNAKPEIKYSTSTAFFHKIFICLIIPVVVTSKVRMTLRRSENCIGGLLDSSGYCLLDLFMGWLCCSMTVDIPFLVIQQISLTDFKKPRGL